MPAAAKVFDVNLDGGVLIVTPHGPARDFPYREVHMQASQVLRTAMESGVKNIVADLCELASVDSVMIESLLRVLTVAKQRGGCAGFCCVPDGIRDVLVRVRLGEVWAEFATREEALEQLRQ